MKKRVWSLIISGMLLVYMVAFAWVGPTAMAEGASRHISGIHVVTADSEEEAVEQLEKDGYTVIRENLAEEGDHLSSPYVYAGYKTSDDPAQSIENEGGTETGSVFGGSVLITIGGIGVILGVIIGMISMKVKDGSKGSQEEKEADV